MPNRANLSRESLAAGWDWYKHDVRSNRTFVANPVLITLIEANLDEWLDELAESLASNNYQPQDIETVEVPKPGGAVRPGANSTPEDAVVYAALVDNIYDAVADRIGEPPNSADYSYQPLRRPLSGPRFKNSFSCWQEFEEESRRQTELPGTESVVGLDIAGYYEHISIESLASEVRSLTGDSATSELLTQLLQKWAVARGRGLPQGYGASDLLGRLYLHAVDEQLQASGIRAVRYVDDFRIFCGSQKEALEAIIALTRMLRPRGLSLQSQKLKLMSPADARMEFDGVIPVVRAADKEFREQLMEILGISDRYLSLGEAETLMDEQAGDWPTEVLERVLKERIEPDLRTANKSLLHFVLNRLGSARNLSALSICGELLTLRPEETDWVLRYVSRCAGWDTLIEPLQGVLTQSPYDYQRYQIVQWLCLNPEFDPGGEIKNQIHVMASSRANPSFLQSAARRYLAIHGRQSDWDMISQQYSSATNHYERAEIIFSIRRMEPVRRNGLYGGWKTDGVYERRAVDWVKGLNDPNTMV